MTSEPKSYAIDERATPIFEAMLKRHADLSARRDQVVRQIRRLDADLAQVEDAAREAGAMYLATRKIVELEDETLSFNLAEDGTIHMTVTPVANQEG